MLIEYTATAGSRTEFQEEANFFRLMKTGGAVTVYFYQQGKEIARSENVSAGYAEVFDQRFDKVAIESTGGQEVQFAMRLGSKISYDTPPKGDVEVKNWSGPFFQGNSTVAGLAATILPAKPGRRYLLVQNKSLAANLFLRLDGTTPSVSNSLMLAPGGSLELSSYCTDAAIKAISDGSASVAYVEG